MEDPLLGKLRLLVLVLVLAVGLSVGCGQSAQDAASGPPGTSSEDSGPASTTQGGVTSEGATEQTVEASTLDSYEEDVFYREEIWLYPLELSVGDARWEITGGEYLEPLGVPSGDMSLYVRVDYSFRNVGEGTLTLTSPESARLYEAEEADYEDERDSDYEADTEAEMPLVGQGTDLDEMNYVEKVPAGEEVEGSVLFDVGGAVGDVFVLILDSGGLAGEYGSISLLTD